MRHEASGAADRQRWNEQVARLGSGATRPSRRVPITVERIVATALEAVREEGYEALTMRQVAKGLGSSPGAIYAHVRDKRQLDDLMLGAVCSRIELPSPRASEWQEQAVDVFGQLRDLYLEHPGLSRVALGAPPQSVDTLRVFEGLLAVVTTGGVEISRAAWAVDAALSYTAAYSMVSLRRRQNSAAVVLERAEVIERLEMLPDSLFPLATRHAREITSGEHHERFDFTLALLFGGLHDG